MKLIEAYLYYMTQCPKTDGTLNINVCLGCSFMHWNKLAAGKAGPNEPRQEQLFCDYTTTDTLAEIPEVLVKLTNLSDN